jgi:membrane protease YdiL (CAAX protease family)
MSDSELTSTERRPPWGYIMTFVWVILAVLVLSPVIGIAMLFVFRPEAISLGGVDLLMKDGAAIAISNIPANVVQVAILALAARRPGWSVAEYLGLVWPSRRQAVTAFLILVPFLLGYDALTYLLGRDIVPPFQVDTYRSARDAGMLPLFCFALVIAAPIAEEIVFRGFLFRGWVRSERAALPGIVLISLLFAVIHMQYDWFGVLQVFCIGLLLGFTRWRSGSTLLTILMHVLANLWATIESMIKVEWLS